VVDNQFAANMARAWNLMSEKDITALGYLVEFGQESELWATIDKGIWNYRNEVVVVQKGESTTDLEEDKVQRLKLWVQMHNLPHRVLTLEGVGLLFSEVGPLLSEIKDIRVNGKAAYKAKVTLDLNKHRGQTPRRRGFENSTSIREG
jgi:Domain of unknown function (DUF4283)